MYKFLVVDDEEIVRRGFQTKIAWSDLGFDFLDPCENGREAIRTIDRTRPDVVMTDICMPIVDGLEVAAYIAEHYSDILVIILSGYDDFEYARSAMRSQVFEYLLKPITSSELTTFMQSVKERLDRAGGKRPQLSLPESGRGERLEPASRPRALGFSETKLSEAQDYLRRNFANKRLSVEIACRDLAVSASFLSRLLKGRLGKTFVELLTEYRVERAKVLLEGSDLKTYAVADAVGYSDPRYFSTIFRKSTGNTPSEYRNTAS